MGSAVIGIVEAFRLATVPTERVEHVAGGSRWHHRAIFAFDNAPGLQASILGHPHGKKGWPSDMSFHARYRVGADAAGFWCNYIVFADVITRGYHIGEQRLFDATKLERFPLLPRAALGYMRALADEGESLRILFHCA